jgi:hypothetical protein
VKAQLHERNATRLSCHEAWLTYCNHLTL